MNILKTLVKTYLLFFGLFFIGRIVLYVIYFDRFYDISIGESLLTFVFGARMDTIVICMILIVPAVLLCLTPKRFSNQISIFLKVYTLIWFLFLMQNMFLTQRLNWRVRFLTNLAELADLGMIR